MTLSQIIVPIYTLLLGALVGLVAKLLKSISANNSGTQALLRDRLLQLFRVCSDKGSASISERENFENMFMQYHNLGGNGVMEDIHTKFFELPIE